MEFQYQNAWLKARILAGRTVGFTDRVAEKNRKTDVENHHRDEWIFIKLGDHSRVRLVVDDAPSFLVDVNRHGELILQDSGTGETLLENLVLEDAVVHAPMQLFLGIYEYCRIGCKFCPLGKVQSGLIHYSLDSVFEDIEKAKKDSFTSIGITTAIPYHLSSEDVADEMIFLVTKIREKVGPNIPIGVSTRIPSEGKLLLLKLAGATEARLNIEIPNSTLSKKLMPNKPVEEIMPCIEMACAVFGRGKVSSNIILGLGENDDDVIKCVEHLAEIGAIATLYPYDPFESEICATKSFQRPTAERLYRLAVAHKEILEKHNLDTCTLLTMCPACSASHIFPGKDL